MAQKMVKIGNSIGVVVPKAVLERTGITIHDSVEIVDEGKGRLVLQKVRKNAGNGGAIDPKVVAWTDAFIEKNKELLERLKDK